MHFMRFSFGTNITSCIFTKKLASYLKQQQQFTINIIIKQLSMSTVNKPKVFVSSRLRFESIPALEDDVLNSQVNLVFLKDLEKDSSLGKDIEIAFWVEWDGVHILESFEKGLLPDLKVVCNHGAGVNHLPLQYFKERGLRVTNTPRVLADCCADLAFALMLASARQLVKGVKKSMESGERAVELFLETDLGQDVSHATLGIVGMGFIGSKCAQRAKAFDMKILYHNRTQRAADKDLDVTYCSKLMDMLPQCDYVIITCPLTDETKELFSVEQFKAMKKTACLVNVARGPIVDTDALVEALKNGEIGAAALDVVNPEPLPVNHPLLSLPNVIITPHWGSATIQTRAKMLQLMVDNAIAYTERKELLSEVSI